MRGEFVDLDGVRLYYYAAGTRGAGEPVVFLHGFPTSGHLWSEVVQQMSPGHRLVVVDLLGYGRSDPPGARPLTLRAHAGQVEGLMNALGIASACIVGHHLGGGVAQSLAVHWPARVSRLALIDSVAFTAWPSRDLRLSRALFAVLKLLPAGWLLPITRADMERGYVDAARASHSIDKYQRPFGSDDGHAVLLRHLRALDSRETSTLSARLAEIAVPTAVIWGEDDPYLPVTLGRRLASAIPHASFDVIAGARHFTPEESPRQISEILGGLLTR